MDTILGILPGESYSGIRALVDLSVCVNKYQQVFWHRCQGNGCWINYESSLTLYHIVLSFYSFILFFSFFIMNSTPIYQYAAPTNTRLEPPKSIEPILTPGYKLCPCLIKLIRDQSFLGEGNENPYWHLREFEQTCACLCIASMFDKTLRWKLFPFSLTGRAKQWYSRTVGSMQGDWETLCSKFCLHSFPISKVVSLRKEVLNFRQLEEESLGALWEHINSLITTGPNLAISDPMLLQHFYMGLNKDSMESLDAASRGAFLHLSASKARTILDKIIRRIPYTSIHDELPE